MVFISFSSYNFVLCYITCVTSQGCASTSQRASGTRGELLDCQRAAQPYTDGEFPTSKMCTLHSLRDKTYA